MSSIETSDKAFLDGFKKYWFIWAPLLVFFIFWIFQSNENEEDLDKKSKQISLKLETIEDQINIEIQNNNKDKALSLTNQLVHPNHVIYEGTQENWYSEDKYYDEYWNEKRKFYKEKILNETLNQQTLNETE